MNRFRTVKQKHHVHNLSVLVAHMCVLFDVLSVVCACKIRYRIYLTHTQTIAQSLHRHTNTLIFCGILNRCFVIFPFHLWSWFGSFHTIEAFIHQSHLCWVKRNVTYCFFSFLWCEGNLEKNRNSHSHIERKVRSFCLWIV